MNAPEMPGPVLLYDGACGLCNASVRFVCRRDRHGRIRYAALQSEVGHRLLEHHQLPLDLSSVVLIEQGRAWVRSDAALRLCGHLSHAWPLLTLLRAVPRPLRDAAYRLIARHRLRLFGTADHCMLPTGCPPERFLQDGEV